MLASLRRKPLKWFLLDWDRVVETENVQVSESGKRHVGYTVTCSMSGVRIRNANGCSNFSSPNGFDLKKIKIET